MKKKKLKTSRTVCECGLFSRADWNGPGSAGRPGGPPLCWKAEGGRGRGWGGAEVAHLPHWRVPPHPSPDRKGMLLTPSRTTGMIMKCMSFCFCTKLTQTLISERRWGRKEMIGCRCSVRQIPSIRLLAASHSTCLLDYTHTHATPTRSMQSEHMCTQRINTIMT